MGLIIILGEDNFTSQFYVKSDGDSRKSNVIDRIEYKIAILAILWPNLAKYEFNYNFWRG